MNNLIYEQGQIAVDAVIFTIKEHNLWVYLNLREKHPFKNKSELPGGILFEKETAEETLARKLEEIVGTNKLFFKQFHTFTNPERDPRGRIISIGFIALVPSNKVLNNRNFHPLNKLPELAFDHSEIIEKAYSYLKQNLDTQILEQFMPEYFPLNDLQLVHELISDTKLDNRNFRKKILTSGLVRKVKKVQQNVSHRPAILYQFKMKLSGKI